MTWDAHFFCTSIGKKTLVAVTGLGLGFFTLVHMSGNLLIFVGPEAYNRYSHTLISNPFLYVAEAGLLVFFWVHLFFAASLTLSNRKAMRGKYQVTPEGEKAASFAAKSMIFSGAVILVFTVLHLITFKFGPEYQVVYGGVEMRDLYRLIVEKFHEPLYVIWYEFALIVLGLHLSHGFSATSQSLGVGSVRTGWIKKTGCFFAVLIAVGFMSQPLFVFFCGER